ncbi:EIN3-binding F-box protein 2-like [Magnolia sinica]|uniref:EIN3-binding F-box protein 2-like n=1 Tax=Magnolia sinica TaxID=86752 RepID=UPI00265A5AB4|nr:EIN3-binding F-box protein 2-like [Magnolia sinica]
MLLSMAHHGADDDFLQPRKRPRLQNNPLTGKSNGLDLISHLPDECIVEIFSFLPSHQDRCSCAAVSRKWLILQANMRSTEFKSNNSIQKPEKNKTSRCLEGMKASDTRLAAIAVGIYPSQGLTHLCIRATYPSYGITDFGLKIIAQAFPTLKSLSLWDCLKVGSEGLASIAKGCKWLEKLDIVNSPSIDDNGLATVTKNCPNLLTLNLDSCPSITNRSLQAVARHSSNLVLISLVKCLLIGDEGIVSILSSLPKLAKLKLISVRAADAVLEAIGRHGKSLRSLCLENVWGVSEIGFCSIGRLENVEFLSLRSCSGLNDMGFKAIGKGFVGLKWMVIRNCQALTDTGLKEVAESAALLECLKLVACNNVSSLGLMEVFMNCNKRLRVLSLVKCGGLKEEEDARSRRAVLPKCPLLESVTLDSCVGVGDSFLSWLGSACVQVKHLELIGLSFITDKGILSLLKSLGTLNKALVSVDLSGCLGVTDRSVLAITSAFGERLSSLRLDGCDGLSDRSLEMIAEFCLCLRELDLSSCGISDDGVFCLAKSKYQCIEVLSLAGCTGITDNSLGFLEMMCGSLVDLNLKQCPQLSKRAIDSVKETLWWCDVLY